MVVKGGPRPLGPLDLPLDIIAVYFNSYVMISSDLYRTCSYCFYGTVLMGLNTVPIKYSSDVHTPKHNYDVISIVDVTV